MMKAAVNLSERRGFGRRESGIEALASVTGRTWAPCMLRNFSGTGALLEFAAPFEAPAKFKLRIESKQLEAICEIRHRNGLTIGVRFVSGNIGAALEREHAMTMAASSSAEAPQAIEARPSRFPATRPPAMTGGELRRLLLAKAPA